MKKGKNKGENNEEEKIIQELMKKNLADSKHKNYKIPLSGFERLLVNSIIMADPNNTKKLKKAYPKLVAFIKEDFNGVIGI